MLTLIIPTTLNVMLDVLYTAKYSDTSSPNARHDPINMRKNI